MPKQKQTLGIFAIAMFWLGLAVGVSFLATPAKFLAPSLSLPVALDVGRHTFAVFNKVEWLLAAALLLAAAWSRAWRPAAGGVLAALILLAETAWLLPQLDQRVSLIIAGQQPPASNLHWFYIVMELVKLGSLVLVAAIAAFYVARQSRASSSSP